MPIKINAGEHWTFGSRDSQRTVGGKSTTVKITVRVETGATSLYGICLGVAHHGTSTTYNGTMSFLLGTPLTTGTGAHTWAGELKVIDISSPVKAKAGDGNVQTCVITLGGDGAITYAVA